mgnify:CR=1 FL=1
MKKLLFSLVAIAFLSLNANAQKKPKKLTSFWPDIEIKFGQNTVLNGIVYPCLNSGLCSITVNKNAISGTTKDFPTKVSFLALDIEGNLFVVAHSSFDRVEFNERIEMLSETNLDVKTLEIINKEIISINPNAPKFTGVKKGTVLIPTNDNNFNFISLN